jgi:hypothetical protein
VFEVSFNVSFDRNLPAAGWVEIFAALLHVIASLIPHLRI